MMHGPKSVTLSKEVVLDNNQLDALFLNVFISCLYMFRATSAHHQEDQVVLIHHLVQHTLVGGCLAGRSGGRIEKECIKLVIIRNYFEMLGQQNIKCPRKATLSRK